MGAEDFLARLPEGGSFKMHKLRQLLKRNIRHSFLLSHLLLFILVRSLTVEP